MILRLANLLAVGLLVAGAVTGFAGELLYSVVLVGAGIGLAAVRAIILDERIDARFDYGRCR